MYFVVNADVSLADFFVVSYVIVSDYVNNVHLVVNKCETIRAIDC